jgi:hypothetical protein
MDGKIRGRLFKTLEENGRGVFEKQTVCRPYGTLVKTFKNVLVGLDFLG